jgi:hypothetical protein
MGIARVQRRPRSSHPRPQLTRPGLRPGLRLAATWFVSGALVVGLVPSASADDTAPAPSASAHSDPAVPTREDVATAEQRVADRARDVGAI